MTLIAVPVFGDSIEGIRAEIREAVRLGAGLIELRLDLMPGVSDDDIRGLCKNSDVDAPFLLTIRSTAEGGDWDGTEEERIERFSKLIPYAELVDVELSTWRSSQSSSGKLRTALRMEVRRQADSVRPLAYVSPRRLILSKHDLSGRPRKLHNVLRDMMDVAECCVAKIAWQARTVRDNFEAFDLMRQGALSPGKPGVFICMGPDGLPSRVLAKKFGAFATFASLRAGAESAPGQVTIGELRERYRWDAIGESTDVYGVIGDPVGHSVSPDVHNAAFGEAGIDAVYLPFRVNPGSESLAAFLSEVVERPELGFGGFSVTTPHKVNALRFVARVKGRVDDVAGRIGAVNTLCIAEGGEISGYNTDYSGFLSALSEKGGPGIKAAKGVAVSVMGAGGVARAVVAAFVDHGARVTILNRTQERGEALAREFGCEVGAWERRAKAEPEWIVNCASVGMRPLVDESPLEAGCLRPGQVVIETVYNPPETRLMREAAAAGCRVVGGMSLFAHQAAAQFELWTGRRLPTALFRERAMAVLRAAPPAG